MTPSQKELQHLIWRAGLFDHHTALAKMQGQTIAQVWAQLKHTATAFTPIVVADQNDFDPMAFRSMSKEEKQQVRKQFRENVKTLNKAWIDHMAGTKAVLRERMALFWHNHFACSAKNSYFLQGYLNTLRKYALGDFRTLLHAVSKTPAMLQYLNNQQNRKQQPNENFAREVMELFTLGRGYYTEADVKNAARAFTGWSFTREGQYILRQRQHDEGKKTLFGQTGNFSGEAVLDMLLDNPQTARFVVTKLYRYLVNEEVNASRVEALADRFYNSGYDIMMLLEAIFLSGWFYDEENIGTKIKSPIDLMVGLQRALYLTFEQPEGPLFIQKALGQLLLRPPNVAGWPGGKNWIDSSTLLFRVRLTEFVLMSSELMVTLKDSGDDNDQLKLKGGLKRLQTKVDQAALEQALGSLETQQLTDFLLQTPFTATLPGQSASSLMKKIVAITKTPEFQLC